MDSFVRKVPRKPTRIPLNFSYKLKDAFGRNVLKNPSNLVLKDSSVRKDRAIATRNRYNIN